LLENRQGEGKLFLFSAAKGGRATGAIDPASGRANLEFLDKAKLIVWPYRNVKIDGLTDCLFAQLAFIPVSGGRAAGRATRTSTAT